MKKLSCFFLSILLVACDEPKISEARRTARVVLFKECMELAAKMPRQADDDVADIVQECGSQSYYMTNAIQ
jgi:hypothetical protein